jgi:hypothetical protein
MTDAAVHDAMPSRRAEMLYDGPSAQRRATVAFRIILAIPQSIVLFFLYLAAIVVLVIGWFAALVLGRLPEWVHTFVSGVVRWATRYYAYLYLLTDVYPPYSLDDEDYPARPILPAGGRLNRWSVLFRLILVIPAYVFVQIVEYGLTVPLLLAAWFIVLFSGRMPPPLYGAYSALLRYQVRLHAYLAMLTSEYAWGMLGDGGVPQHQTFFAPLPPPPAASGGAPAFPGVYPPPPTQTFAYPSAPAPPIPPPPPPSGIGAMPPPSERERLTRPSGSPEWATLVLAGAARGWMIFAIVWGSILFVGQNIAQTALRHHRHTTAQPAPTGVHRFTMPSDAGNPLGLVVTLPPRGMLQQAEAQRRE